jgi:S1-C subfamily serine protease
MRLREMVLLSVVWFMSVGGIVFGQCGPGGCPSGGDRGRQYDIPNQGGGCGPNGCPGQNQGQKKGNLPKLDESKYPGVVLITASSGGKESSKFSGFIADCNGTSDIVVTCAHGYTYGESLIVHAGGADYPAEIIAVDTPRDLMVLRISETGIEPMVIDMNGPKIGDKVFMLGFANASVLVGVEGRIANFDKNGDSLMTTCDVWHGCSGGPIVDSQGRVVGTVTAGMGNNPGQGRIETGPLINCMGPCLAFTLNRLKCKQM